MKFKEFSATLHAIEQVSSRLEITDLLARLLKAASADEASKICYMSLGELQPPYLGTQFNIADKTVVRIIASLLKISIADVTDQLKHTGDLGSLLINRLPSTDHDLTLLAVYDRLTSLEDVSGSGSQELKAGLLHDLLDCLDGVSAKYVVRIVLGKLRLGFSDMTVVDALSWMQTGDKTLRSTIEDAYNVCADIGLIATTLKSGGIDAIRHMSIRVGIPIRPAAAERLACAKAVVDKLGHCVAQLKLDGFRLQIHVDKRGSKPIIHFFSRNLQDMSHMFPDLVKHVEHMDVETLICEGEAICYDPNTGSFLPFQETVKRKRKHGIEDVLTDFPLKVFLFDLLYLNGKSLLSESHQQRRSQLVSVGKKIHDPDVQVIEEVVIDSAQHLQEYFLKTIDAGLEGLVVKRIDAPYQPGKRNFNWIKLKRAQVGHLQDTVDPVILGYYSGEGKRAAFGIGAFLVGVYNQDEDCFETVAKVGTGMKDHEWRELKKKCDAIASPDKPHNVVCSKDLTPDVWTFPELVCVIRADEITQSPVHTAGKTKSNLGYALRFPRFLGYRPDKKSSDATTTYEIKRLYQEQYA